MLLQMIIASVAIFTAVVSLAQALGRGLPNNKLAFNTLCGTEPSEIYVTDWKRALTVNFTKSPTEEASLTWSPNGQQFAFERFGADNHAIYVAHLDGFIYKLSNRQETEIRPLWSPNGRYIAFASQTTGGNARLSVADLTTDTIDDFSINVDPNSLAWSPNSQSLAFHINRNDGTTAIYSLNVATGTSVNLSGFLAGNWFPTWSPDGTQLAFTTDRDGINQIYIADIATSSVTKFPRNTTTSYTGTTWSPDGEQIATIADEQIIEILNAFGETIRVINPQIAGHLNAVAWSPHGDYLAVEATVRLPTPTLELTFTQSILVVDVTSGDLYDISPLLCPSEFATWSPS